MFQNFDAFADHSSSAERLAALRAELKSRDLDGFVVPRADEYQNEYIPPSAARLEWLTGFNGSAGTVLVLRERAFILVDGRYTLQVRSQVDLSHVEPVSSVETSLGELLKGEAGGLRIGFDPWLHPLREARRLAEVMEESGGRLVPVSSNPVDAVWTERPAPPAGAAFVHPERFAGRSVPDKLADLGGVMEEAGVDAAILTDPASVCWTFNIRGSDVAHTPLVLAFAILARSGRPTVYVDPRKITDEVRAHLAPIADIADPGDFEAGVVRTAQGAAKIGLDPQLAAARLADVVREAGGTVVETSDPARRLRAIKNETEIKGAVAAQIRDGAALAGFLAWLDRQPPSTVSEIAAVEKLEAMRAEHAARDGMELKDISFDTIAGSGPNGAIVHYRVDRRSDRMLGEGELFLVDSGGQYEDGTTDVTRTVAIGEPSPEMRRAFTLVLKGMIAISAARFPAGSRGVELDPLARRALWLQGWDYAHGTGHGVGSFLSVHEGPQSISRRGTVPIEAGMILSNEPGYYREGAFGIRIENLICAEGPEEIPGGDRLMMKFRTLTFVPIDLRLVEPLLLDEFETEWLDAYHEEVGRVLEPRLDPIDRPWLGRMTAPVQGSRSPVLSSDGVVPASGQYGAQEKGA